MTFLCRSEEVTDRAGRDATVGEGDAARELVLVRKDGRIRAYVNSCPHMHMRLNMFPHEFLTRDKKHIFCSTHGAQFRLDDGLCTLGPCKGEALTPVAVEERDGGIYLAG